MEELNGVRPRRSPNCTCLFTFRGLKLHTLNHEGDREHRRRTLTSSCLLALLWAVPPHSPGNGRTSRGSVRLSRPNLLFPLGSSGTLNWLGAREQASLAGGSRRARAAGKSGPVPPTAFIRSRLRAGGRILISSRRTVTL